MKRTVKKGRHWSWPFSIKRLLGNSHTFTVRAEKPDMWKYEFPPIAKLGKAVTTTEDGLQIIRHPLEFKHNPNQWDWNKLVGIKKNLLQPRKNSVMIGWRYNPVNDCVEFVPYWHDENGGAHFEYEPLIIPCSRVNRSFELNIQFRNSSVTLIAVNRDTYGVDFIESRFWDLPQNAYMKSGWLITHWFGGQMKAIKDIVMNFKYST